MRRAPRLLDALLRTLPLGLRARAGTGPVRVSYDAFNRQDIETLLDIYHQECVWKMSNIEGWPDAPVYEGHEGLHQIFRDWYGQWEDFHVTPARVLQSDQAIFITCELSARGKTSGVRVEQTWLQVAAIRDGKIALIDNYSDRDEALRAFARAG